MEQKFTILFDLDGTLVDTAPDLMLAHNHVMKKFGFPTKTTEDIRGRALALRGTIAQMLRPLGVVIAGPLGDYLEFTFYPENVDILSPLVGTGPGRGYAFLFFLVGVFYVVLWIVNFNNKNLKFLSKQVIEITNS